MHVRTSQSILFLEDNIEFARNMIEVFSVFVENVHHAKTIEEAEHFLRDFSIDIIISDIKLKNESGLDFIKKVRDNDKEVAIIILSGHKDESFLFRSIPLNLTAYLVKPIKYNELIEVFQRCQKKSDLNNNVLTPLIKSWVFDNKTKTLNYNSKWHVLNKKEVLFIELISLNHDRLITKEMFQSYVWQEKELSDSALTSFIFRIRRRFGKTFIFTVPDLGYRLTL
jgi:two-component system, OmpR family, response regulator VanR